MSQALASRSRLPSRQSATSGRNGVQFQVARADGLAIAWSLAITSMAAWVTASGMTGLTLPGMIEEPAWRAGRRISPRPASGPRDSSRRSLAIFSRLRAQALRMPLTSTKTSAFCVASTRFSARARPRPVMLAQVLDDAEDVLPRGAEAGADGRAAEVHHAQPLLALVDAPAVAAEGLGVGAHLAAERGQHGVLQLRAADLDDVGELPSPCAWNASCRATTSRSSSRSRPDGGQPQGRGVGVVGGLVQVDVVERARRVS